MADPHARGIFEIVLFFEDESKKTFRTDEWNETILRERLEKAGKKVVKEERRGKGDLDEASGAYKDIGEVMKQQEDLVDIVVELSPLGVVKG